MKDSEPQESAWDNTCGYRTKENTINRTGGSRDSGFCPIAKKNESLGTVLFDSLFTMSQTEPSPVTHSRAIE